MEWLNGMLPLSMTTFLNTNLKKQIIFLKYLNNLTTELKN